MTLDVTSPAAVPSGGTAGIRAVLRRMRAPRVLMYHCFGAPPPGGDPDRQFVALADLRRQLAWLAATGWRSLSLTEYLGVLGGAPAPRRSYLVTIDDGHESVLRVAAPVLVEFGVRAALFVPPDLIGATMSWAPPYAGERLLRPEDLRALAGAGLELGVHGLDHTRMTEVDPAGLAAHVTRARDRLHELTGTRPRAFAYPYGTHDARTRAAVGGAGFDVAFAVARERGVYGVSRIVVDGGDSLAVFRFKLSLAYRVLAEVAGRTPGLRHRVRAVVAAARTLRPRP